MTVRGAGRAAEDARGAAVVGDSDPGHGVSGHAAADDPVALPPPPIRAADASATSRACWSSAPASTRQRRGAGGRVPGGSVSRALAETVGRPRRRSRRGAGAARRAHAAGVGGQLKAAAALAQARLEAPRSRGARRAAGRRCSRCCATSARSRAASTDAAGQSRPRDAICARSPRTFDCRARDRRLRRARPAPQQALERNASPKIVADWVARAL